MPTAPGTTIGTSIPTALTETPYASGAPTIWFAETTCLTSDVSSTGFWRGAGRGGRTGNPGMVLGDILMHRQTTATAKPSFVSMHAVVSSTASFLSTVASSGWGAVYDVTVSACT